jgi:hypothetical protein
MQRWAVDGCPSCHALRAADLSYDEEEEDEDDLDEDEENWRLGLDEGAVVGGVAGGAAGGDTASGFDPGYDPGGHGPPSHFPAGRSFSLRIIHIK